MRGAPERSGAVIGWVDTHGRSVGLAAALDLDEVFMPWARPRLPRRRTVTGWVRSAARTFRACRRLPMGSLVIVQVPPVFAAVAALLAVHRHAVVLDLHSGALNDPLWRWSHGLLAWTARRCAAVIVTTSSLLEGIDLGGTPVFELHDPLLDRRVPVPPERSGVAPAYVVFPAGGAADEPFEAVVEAATRLAPAVEVLVTGRVTERLIGTEARATGFLPDEEYLQLLAGATAVLALTTREHTMQRTAYEALELGVPIVASDTDALRTALGGAAVYVEPAGAALADAILEAAERSAELRAAGLVRFEEIRSASEAVFDRLRALPPRARRA